MCILVEYLFLFLRSYHHRELLKLETKIALQLTGTFYPLESLTGAK